MLLRVLVDGVEVKLVGLIHPSGSKRLKSGGTLLLSKPSAICLPWCWRWGRIWRRRRSGWEPPKFGFTYYRLRFPEANVSISRRCGQGDRAQEVGGFAQNNRSWDFRDYFIKYHIVSLQPQLPE